MAQIQELYDRTSGETIYPRTITSAVLTPNGTSLDHSMASEKEATDKAIEAAKRALFVDMWKVAVGDYGTVDHAHHDADGRLTPYKCDIWLTYDEAVATMSAGHLTWGAGQQYGSMNIKVNLPPTYGFNNNFLGSQMFDGCKAEVIILAKDPAGFLQGSWSSGSVRNCPNLRRIANAWRMPTPPAGQPVQFVGLPKLVDFRILALEYDLIIPDSPLLSLESVACWVANATNTKAITITVHADVMAKLTGDTTNAAVAALSAEELAQWQQVLADAAAKDITFATK